MSSVLFITAWAKQKTLPYVSQNIALVGHEGKEKGSCFNLAKNTSCYIPNGEWSLRESLFSEASHSLVFSFYENLILCLSLPPHDPLLFLSACNLDNEKERRMWKCRLLEGYLKCALCRKQALFMELIWMYNSVSILLCHLLTFCLKMLMKLNIACAFAAMWMIPMWQVEFCTLKCCLGIVSMFCNICTQMAWWTQRKAALYFLLLDASPNALCLYIFTTLSVHTKM